MKTKLIVYQSVVILFMLGFSVFAAPAVSIVSPPLNIIEQKHLSVAAPAGWIIVHRDPPEYWNSSSFDVEIKPITGNSKNVANIEILMQPITRAQRHGDLLGTPYRNLNRVQGLVHTEYNGNDGIEWYFSVPIRKTNGVVIIRIVGLHGTVRSEKHTAYEIFRSVNFCASRPKSQ